MSPISSSKKESCKPLAYSASTEARDNEKLRLSTPVLWPRARLRCVARSPHTAGGFSPQSSTNHLGIAPGFPSTRRIEIYSRRASASPSRPSRLTTILLLPCPSDRKEKQKRTCRRQGNCKSRFGFARYCSSRQHRPSWIPLPSAAQLLQPPRRTAHCLAASPAQCSHGLPVGARSSPQPAQTAPPSQPS